MARACGETRARASEFARLGQDLNQSALGESLGVSRARINTLFKIWNGLDRVVDDTDAAGGCLKNRRFKRTGNGRPPSGV